jgi:replicative superfamily II helicase
VVGLGQTLYSGVFTHFNAIQTQVFTSLYDSDENVLVAAPPGSGKTVCAELALLRLFTANADATAVYIAPIDAIAKVNARRP